VGARRPGTEAAIAVQVECQPLKQPPHGTDPITAPFEHLQLVVEPFDEPAGRVMREVVRDQVLPGIQQLQEALETGQPAPRHALPPEPDAPQSIGFRAGRVKDPRQLLAQRVGLLERGALREQAIQPVLFRLRQILGALAERPQRALQVSTRGIWQLLPQAPDFLLPQLIHRVAILAGHVKAVNHDRGVGQYLLRGRDVALPHIGTDRCDGLTPGRWHRLQPGHYARLQAIG